jgi:hypothetical protein
MTRKRKRVADSALMQEFVKQVKAENEDIKFLLNAKGEINMSDAIKHLIEPFSEDTPDFESFRGLVTLACVAWNTTLFSDEKREKVLVEMMDVFEGSVEDQVETFNLLGDLMERKRKLFPSVSRMIVEHKVTDRGGDFHIAIASTLEKKDIAE